MFQKISENNTMDEEEAKETAKMVALSAIKYGDLSNQASKDYIFDIDRFISFEGNTGPYILYTIVRIKSILKKYAQSGKSAADYKIQAAHSASEKGLMLELARFNEIMINAAEELARIKICAYIYGLANALNHFYHETKIISKNMKQYRLVTFVCWNLPETFLEKLSMYWDLLHLTGCKKIN